MADNKVEKMNDVYSNIAGFYDYLMQDVDYKAWADFIYNSAKQYNCNINSALEIACGSCAIAIRLAQRGIKMIGCDLSDEMLDAASSAIRQNGVKIQLCAADMTDFKLNYPVDLVVCNCDGINYISSQENLYRLFKTTNGNLSDNGVFIFDMSTHNKYIRLNNQWCIDDSDKITAIWHYECTDNMTTIQTTVFSPGGNNMYYRHDREHIHYTYEPQLITQIAEETGFKLQRVCSDFDYNLNDNAERLYYILQKVNK